MVDDNDENKNTPKFVVKGVHENAGGIVGPPSDKNRNESGNALDKTREHLDFANVKSSPPKAANHAELDFSAREYQVNLEYGKADDYRSRLRRTVFYALVFVFLAGTGGYFFVPQLGENIDRVFVDIKSKLEIFPKLEDDTAKIEQNSLTQHNKAAPKSKAAIRRNDDCAEVIAPAAGPSSKIIANNRQKIKAAECYMHLHEYDEAYAILRSIVADSRENSKINHFTFLDGPAAKLFLMAATMIKMGQYQKASDLYSRRCLKWEANNSCVGKLYIDQQRGLHRNVEEGINAIKRSLDKTSYDARAIFYLTAGKFYQSRRNLNLANNHFKLAIQLAKHALIKKWAYESHALFFYQTGEYEKVQKVAKEALATLAGLQKAKLFKLFFYSRLGSLKSRDEMLAAILNKNKYFEEIKKDPEYLFVLGTEAVKRHSERELLELVKMLKSYLQTKNTASANAIKLLTQWELRAHISAGNNRDAIKKSLRYEKAFKPDAVSSHLKGIAYMNLDDSRDFFHQASRLFQLSVSANPNWENKYALGVALLKSGKTKGVDKILKSMEKHGKSSSELYWTNILKVQWYLANGMYSSAEKLLIGISKKRGATYAVLEQYRDLSKAQKNWKLAKKYDLELDTLKAKYRYISTKEGESSPLGALAMMPRPSF